jgi:glutathione S-transferase
MLLKPERRNQANVDRAGKLLSQMLTAVDRGLQGREFLAGVFSCADIMTGHTCIVASRLGADVADKLHVVAYVERLQARPALQCAWEA